MLFLLVDSFVRSVPTYYCIVDQDELSKANLQILRQKIPTLFFQRVLFWGYWPYFDKTWYIEIGNNIGYFSYRYSRGICVYL